MLTDWRFGLTFIALLWLGPAAVPPASASDNPLMLSAEERRSTEGHLQVHVDSAAGRDFSAQLERARGGQYQLSEEASPHFGYSDAAIWLYLPISAPVDEGGEWLVEIQHPLLGEVSVEAHHADGRVQRWEAGQKVPFAQWPKEHRNVTIPLHMEAGEQVELLFRIASNSSLQTPIVVWPEAAFAEANQQANLWFGLFYGVILALLLYNLLLYFGLRDISYLYYVAYVGLYLLSQLILNGLAFQYLWPRATAWAEMSTSVIVAMAFVAAALFSRSFLQLPSRMPVANKVVLGLAGAFVLAVLLAIVFSPRVGVQLTAGLSVINTFALVAIATLSLRAGFLQARYFLLAWTIFLLGTAIYGLRAIGLLPNVFLTEFGVQIGAVVQMLMLSFALAHRMRVTEWEKARVEREAKVNLEKRVRERTAELDSALGELSNSNKRLENRTRLFESLVEVNQLAPGVRNPESLLVQTLPLLARALPDTGLAVVARVPKRATAITHVHFHGIEPAIQKRILGLLRGKRIDSELPVKLPDLGDGHQGLLITMNNRLRQLEGLFIMVKKGSNFQADEREAGVLFADHLGASMEAVLLQRRLEARADTEMKTGLYKRAHLEKVLHREIEHRKAHDALDFGMLCLRVHGLDSAREQYGDQAAEQIVLATARGLREHCRPGDEAGHWRGEQLALVCPGTRRQEMEKLQTMLGKALNGQKLTLTARDGSPIDYTVMVEMGASTSDEATPEAVSEQAVENMRKGAR
ncbi:7TM diverse intracellular signaling domain-containing protein [Natronospira bacteriovora]|uniref:7TM diverse intracellular signaling domain-containing protein n=1 Tax=Natronospira bacteriovora TaxID=3069753 RepID=A0ABU0WBH2_9GAMM|nr:7TM diverse intracellular signaling domain-containing protein [Natronospira sp. AB-CW4]MDQ2070810.1 7TM diverse intracellular signaling domain-containing protein [Natronospira sp. AB-CW4]